ncbi:MAG: HEAT repeat domain-containing protein [Candidatus Omnitrophica bacterium]|nr:HEAT repeat domain-containing protein [Candidatus Omnitrophota bacterium]
MKPSLRNVGGVVVWSLIASMAGPAIAGETVYYRIAPDGEVTAKTAAAWASGLNDADAPVRQEVAWMLGRIGDEATRALPQVIQLLDDPVEAVRDQAVETLYYLGPESVAALRQVIEREGQTDGRHDTGVRAQRLAVEAVSSLGWRSPEAKALLLRIVLDRRLHSVVRYEAFGGLGRLGTGAPGVAPVLVELAQRTDEDSSLRQGAIQTLTRLGAPEPGVVEALGRLLTDQDVWARRAAASALNQFGAAALGARPQLEAARADADTEVRLSADAALKQLAGGTP